MYLNAFFPILLLVILVGYVSSSDKPADDARLTSSKSNDAQQGSLPEFDQIASVITNVDIRDEDVPSAITELMPRDIPRNMIIREKYATATRTMLAII